MQDLLAGLARLHGITVLLATRDVEEAVYLNDRVVVLAERVRRGYHGPMPPVSPTDAFEDLLRRYAAAVAARDVEDFVALYADDLQVFDLWGPWELRGIAAWREMATGWFASLGNERLRVAASNAEATASGDLLIGRATLTFTALSATGDVVRSLDSRLTLAARRSGDGGRWQIFHEHSSAPIAHDTLKAVLRRTPSGTA